MNVCVFCGSNVGLRDAFRLAATDLGRSLARKKIGLVYGGGSVGLMGVIADAVLEQGGEVIGVLPRSMTGREVAHRGLSRLDVVEGMHPRKARMASLSSGFIALPGGFGTFEELFEVVTWLQLGYHRKPVGILNVEGYFDPFLKLVDNGIKNGFIKPSNRDLLTVESDPDRLLDRILEQIPEEGAEWVDLQEI